MKKWILSLLALVLCATLAACAETEDVPAAPDGEPAAQGQSAGSVDEAAADAEFAGGYVCRLDDGVDVPLGAEADDVLAALGEPGDVMEAPSCIREGTDRVYTYAGRYTVTTQPDAAGRDRITELTFLSDAVALDVDGQILTIGSDVEAADAAFGAPSEEGAGFRRYTPAGALVSVTEIDGEITGLTVSYPMG